MTNAYTTTTSKKSVLVPTGIYIYDRANYIVWMSLC